ncbi:MAG: helix-turn-helix domain-containing protein [Lachnospiraceae bacterium]|nr:helix-turn-helix domain-containing protein [Lachnospiraceae bacterium]
MEAISLGKRLKELRIKKGLTQDQLAEMTDLSGAQISTFETGKRNVTLPNLISLAEALETSLDYLVYGTGEEKSRHTAHKYSSGERTAEDLVNALTYLMDNYYIHKDNEGFLLLIDGLDTVDLTDICDTYAAIYGGTGEFIPEDTRAKLLEALTEKIKVDVSCRNILIESRKNDDDFPPSYMDK